MHVSDSKYIFHTTKNSYFRKSSRLSTYNPYKKSCFFQFWVIVHYNECRKEVKIYFRNSECWLIDFLWKIFYFSILHIYSKSKMILILHFLNGRYIKQIASNLFIAMPFLVIIFQIFIEIENTFLWTYS